MLIHPFITDKRYNPELHSINNLVGKTILNVYCGVTIEDVCKWVENKKGRMVHRVIDKKIKFEPHLGLFFYLSDGTFASLISHVVDNHGKMHDGNNRYNGFSSIDGGEFLLNEKILTIDIVDRDERYKSKSDDFAYWYAFEIIEIATSKGKCVIEYYASTERFAISPENKKENEIYATMNHVEFLPNDFEGHWVDDVHEIK